MEMVSPPAFDLHHLVEIRWMTLPGKTASEMLVHTHSHTPLPISTPVGGLALFLLHHLESILFQLYVFHS